VNAANKSPAVKDQLLLDSDRWQWAVNWLKNKMGTGNDAAAVTSSSTSNYWNSSSSLSPSSTSDVVSNEDPTTRTFHRTTSALLTLEDANAILVSIL
jgi:ubiquitin carboxyl-terminal hydrolase 9/24